MIVSVECLGSPPQRPGRPLGFDDWWKSASGYTVTYAGGPTGFVPHKPSIQGDDDTEENRALLALYFDVRDWVIAGGVPTEGGVPRERV